MQSKASFYKRVALHFSLCRLACGSLNVNVHEEGPPSRVRPQHAWKKVHPSSSSAQDEIVAVLHPQRPRDPEMESRMQEAFNRAYAHFLDQFDMQGYRQQAEQISFLAGQPGFKAAVASAPHCDFGVPPPQMPKATAVAPFPGGIASRLFGADLSQVVTKLASNAATAGDSKNAFPGILATQALAQGAGLIQSAMHVILQVVPPLIPPPVWINQPLPCLPMVTGMNCLGSVLYPITAADFVTADITDAQLSGTIADFPRLYRDRIGSTSNDAYKVCFGAYMGMQCASVFPACSTIMAREEPGPVGRLPLCFTSCILTLVACPGIWITDMKDECSMVAAPPMCSMAVFVNMALLPPQYQTFEASLGVPAECPQAPASLGALEPGQEFDLYSVSEAGPSPYDAAGTGSVPHAF
ncbi:unnamed protein product [Amoebophrya sp. A25]|nr:unnamed protein product [Amoebophrya sp. A25]|eukprot:GSA25T00026328001.1